jgi:hypothetical protein
MRIDPDTCRDPDILAAEVRRLQAVIAASDTLTDAERTCLAYAIRKMDAEYAAGPSDVLRGLLERNGAVDGRETVR